jgi:hypothetical protein
MEDGVMADDDTPNPPTVLDRMIGAGIPRERALAYLEAGAVILDGQHVSDPDLPAPPPARISVSAG